MNKILGIVVLYNPDVTLLKDCLYSILSQVDHLWISDNSPSDLPEICLLLNHIPSNKITYYKFQDNVGIATAQNEGIMYAQKEHYSHVFFSDQDSIIPNNVVKDLICYSDQIIDKGLKVGAIGPIPINRKTGIPYKFKMKSSEISNNIFEVSELMNSSSLFRVEVFNNIGLMEDRLFIDGVDYEICWRAHSLLNYRFFIIPDLKIEHQLGEGDRRFLGRELKISTPFRTYYQFRNYLWLFRRQYVPVNWKVRNGIKYLFKYFYYPLLCKPRFEYFKRINKGIIEGIIIKKK